MLGGKKMKKTTADVQRQLGLPAQQDCCLSEPQDDGHNFLDKESGCRSSGAKLRQQLPFHKFTLASINHLVKNRYLLLLANSQTLIGQGDL